MTGQWKPIKYSNGMQEMEYTVQTTRTMEEETTKQWSREVSVAVSKGFDVPLIGELNVEVTGTFAESSSKRVLEAIEESSSVTVKSLFEPGRVWQFTYTTEDTCGYSAGTIQTRAVVQTIGDTEPPCCLPGYAFPDACGALVQHGPCADGSPCFCEDAICNQAPDDSCNTGEDGSSMVLIIGLVCGTAGVLACILAFVCLNKYSKNRITVRPGTNVSVKFSDSI